MSDRLHVALIDDDAAVLDALRYYLARQTIRTSTFQAAEDFLEAFDRHEQFDCVVSDVRMPGMSGLDLMKHLNERSFAGTVILITGHGDIAMAVGAIKNGAFDFIEKPFDEGRLLVSIRQGAERMRQSESEAAELDELQSRFDSLSARQREVMELAVAGLSSKEIAIRLNISPKTVENHRSWVMERIGARNVADLIRKAMKIRAFGNRFG
jgi:two-component system response regulator FixJ